MKFDTTLPCIINAVRQSFDANNLQHTQDYMVQHTLAPHKCTRILFNADCNAIEALFQKPDSNIQSSLSIFL